MKFGKARARHLKLGRLGERKAVELLRAKGVEVLCRNYKCKYGEIDIVARDGGVLCFIEVKTRRKQSKSRPARGLRPKQKKRIVSSGLHYMNKLDNPKVVYRFDLIEMVYDRFDFCEARYWPHHFSSIPKNFLNRQH